MPWRCVRRNKPAGIWLTVFEAVPHADWLTEEPQVRLTGGFFRQAGVVCAVILALSTALAPRAEAQNAQFKGWAAVSRELSTRLAPPGVSLNLHQFVPADDLDELLGTWNRFGDEHTFQNGSPNSVSMVIWRVALSGFAKSVAGSCGQARLSFHERFLRTLRTLCRWPAEEAKADAVLQEFWFSVMGHNAPQGEYSAWREFFLASYASRSATETIDAMTLAITMNPYFLLHR
jgi:hypothetical protein